jgi:hypothetical protein
MSQYLVKVVGKKQNVAHYWDSEKQDTICRLWSTGGIHSKDNFVVKQTPHGRAICKLCKGKADPVATGRQQQRIDENKSLETRLGILESRFELLQEKCDIAMKRATDLGYLVRDLQK